MILICCDKKEREFVKHLELYPWTYAVPHNAHGIHEKLEDAAEAERIPMLSIINVQKNSTEVAVRDVRRLVTKMQNVSEAVEEVKNAIINAA